MRLKLTRELLVGSVVRRKGDIIEAEGKKAELIVRSGAAVPVPPPVESAELEPPAERATRR